MNYVGMYTAAYIYPHLTISSRAFLDLVIDQSYG